MIAKRKNSEIINKNRNWKQLDIVSRTPAVSSMPPVSAILKKHEIRDLIAYLTTLNEGTGK